MRKTYAALLAFIVVCLAGCVPVDSLNPLYTDADVIFDDALVGQWVPVDHSQEQIVFKFERVKGGYILWASAKNKNDKYGYLVHLLSIGKNRFLDVVPANVDISTLENPLKMAQSKSGKYLEPPLVHLGLGAYLEVPEGAQTKAYVKGAHCFSNLSSMAKSLVLMGQTTKNFCKQSKVTGFTSTRRASKRARIY